MTPLQRCKSLCSSVLYCVSVRLLLASRAAAGERESAELRSPCCCAAAALRDTSENGVGGSRATTTRRGALRQAAQARASPAADEPAAPHRRPGAGGPTGPQPEPSRGSGRYARGADAQLLAKMAAERPAEPRSCRCSRGPPSGRHDSVSSGPRG